MNALANVQIDASMETEKDSLGGMTLRNSGAELMTVKLAYFMKSPKGSIGVTCVFVDAQSKEYKETFYATNKDGEVFYKNSEGEKRYLQGFLLADALSLLTSGVSINEANTEEKVVKIYNSESKSEVPTKVDCLVDIMGKQVILGILKQRVNKTVKNEATGKYDPINEDKEENVVDKIFRAKDGMTTAEVRAGVASAEFLDAWKERWTNKLRDRFKEVKGGAKAGSPRGSLNSSAVSGAAAPKSSLFA